MAADNTLALIESVNAALNGDWHRSHNIAQDYNDSIANWIHAVLHKMEPDEWNSRYWYGRTDKRYEDFIDPMEEFRSILEVLTAK